MKKIISVLLAGILCSLCTLTLASCNESNSEHSEEFSGLEFQKFDEGNRIIYKNLENLENDSDLIVVGTFIGDAKQEEVYTYESHFEKEILSFVVSQNNIEISKVIKGDVSVGDEIVLKQLYGVIDDQFMTDSNLTPMLKEDTWLFFLSKNNDGAYYCTGDNDGRYPLKNFSYRRIALTDNEDLGVYNKEDFREDIYSEILEKYDFE